MDFSNRNVQSQVTNPGAQNAAGSNGGNKKNKVDKGRWSRIGFVGIVAAVVILLSALIAAVAFSGGNSQAKYVDNSKLQAVFLNTGQVYFGNIKTLNNKYFVVSNIYYLQTSNANGSDSANSSNAKTNVSLVKLGCELHEPFDQMVINSDQVTFWENLQDNGQVAKAVAAFEKQNPNGQKCADQSTSSSSTSNSAQPANSNSGSSNTNSSNP